MAERISDQEFERLATEADMRRQADEVRSAQSAATAQKATADIQLNEMAAGPALDTRNLPSAPNARFLPRASFEQQQFLSQAERPGVPLDTTTGAPAGLRALASQLPEDPQSQLAFWQDKLGSDKVDLVNGRYVLRNVKKKDGAISDIVVDEDGISGGDLADALREAPELVVSALASFPSPGAAVTRGAQIMKHAVWPSLRSALGFQATKEAKNLATRIFSDVPVKPMDVMSDTEQAAWDTLFGSTLGALPVGIGAMAGAARHSIVKPALAAATGLESHRGITQAEGFLAREALAKDTPIGQIPVSAGQLTGFVPLIRMQQIAEKIPIVGARIARAKARQLTKEKELQRYMVAAEPRSGELGSKLITELRAPFQRMENELTEMKKLLGDEQTAKIAQSFALNQPEISGLEAALSLKTGTEGVYATWRGENAVNYGRLYGMEEAQARAIPTAGIKTTLNDVVLSRQAKRVEDVEVPEFRQSRLGESIESEVPIPGTLPSGIQSLSNQLQAFGDNATLQELVDLRGRINDAIKDPDILPGVDDYMRKQLSGAITESIQSYAAAVPNKEFSEALVTANKHYREKVDLFESPGVRPLLLPREGRFAVNLDEYADSIFRGGRGAVERYQRVKGLLGEQSGAVQQFRQHFLQRLGSPAVNPVTRSIDVADLAKAVQRLPKEMAADLFPQSRTAILDAARAGEFARGKLSFDEVASLLSADKLTSTKIREIAAKQERLDTDMRNSIFKSIKEGNIDDISVQPDVFVDSVLLSPKVPVSQLRDAVDLIGFRNPPLADDISFKYMAKMFREAADSSVQENITLGALGRPERAIDPKKFAAFFDGPDKQERLLAVIGPKRFEILNNFNKHMATRSFAQEAAGAGGLFASNLLLDVFSLKNWGRGLKIGAMAALLSDSKLLRLLSTPPPSGTPLSTWNKYLMRLAVLTPEFRRKISDELNEEELEQAAAQIQAETAPPAAPAQATAPAP